MKSKMLALFAILVLSVAIAGTAYAAWVENFTLSSIVTTGNFDVDISSTVTASNTPYSNPVYPSALANNQDPTGGGGMSLIFDKAFPGAFATATITFTNNGNLPAKVTSVGPLIVSEAGFQVPATGKLDIVFAGTNPPDVGDVIQPGQSMVFTMTVTVLDGALPDTMYVVAYGASFGVA